MFVDRQDLGLRVQMVDGCCSVTAGDEAETLVLNQLETMDRGSRIVRVNNRSRKIEEGADEGLERRC